MSKITVRLINGDSLEVDKELCETFTDVKAQVAARLGKFIPHVLLIASDQSTVLEDEIDPQSHNNISGASSHRELPCTVYAVMREGPEFTTVPTTATFSTWLHIVGVHAKYQDMNGLNRALQLMTQQPDIDPYSVLKLTLLRCAFSNMTSVTEWMLENGVNVNCMDSRGSTPLMNAVTCDNVPMVKQFLKYGARVDTCNNSGWNPMTSAACAGRRTIIEHLQSHGADINGMDTFGMTPLCAAVERGHTDLAIWLVLERKADVNHSARRGLTPLRVAIDRKNGAAAAKLIELGANPNAPANGRRSNGGTPAQTLVERAQELGGSTWEHVRAAVNGA